VIYIIGEKSVRQMQAFNDVRSALSFDKDVYLGAMLAKPLGIELSGVGIYNMEPLHDDSPLWDIGYMETLKNCHVIDYSKKNVEYLKGSGVEAFHMPYGHHDGLVKGISAEKDIDVLFIGSVHFDRRRKLLDTLAKHFGVMAVTDTYGNELDRVMSRAKLHINVHHMENQQLQVVRLNYLIANGCNVVSEYGCEQEVNEQYRNMLTFTDYNGFVDACYRALEHPVDGSEELRKMRQDCSYANNWLNGVSS
jgi:hypothetical protein